MLLGFLIKLVVIYTTKSNHSCRKAIAWLRKNNIMYVVERIVSGKSPLTEKEIMRMLNLSKDVYEIISTRSKVYKELNENMEEMHVKSELIPFLLKNNHALTYPITIQGNKLQTGFREINFGVFIPRNKRKEAIAGMLAELQVM